MRGLGVRAGIKKEVERAVSEFEVGLQEGRPEAAIEVLKQQTLTGSSEKLQVRLAHAYRERGQGAAPSEIDEPCLKLALLLYQGVLSQNPQCFEAQQVTTMFNPEI